MFILFKMLPAIVGPVEGYGEVNHKTDRHIAFITPTDKERGNRVREGSVERNRLAKKKEKKLRAERDGLFDGNTGHLAAPGASRSLRIKTLYYSSTSMSFYSNFIRVYSTFSIFLSLFLILLRPTLAGQTHCQPPV